MIDVISHHNKIYLQYYISARCKLVLCKIEISGRHRDSSILMEINHTSSAPGGIKKKAICSSPRGSLLPILDPVHTTALSCVLPEDDQKGNIWICSEGCNFRSSPTVLIPSHYVYFGPGIWSISRFLRSNH